jgi:competence protein ComEC
VRPTVAVLSVGAGDRYGHPHAEVLARYAGALALRTDQHGDVTLRSDGERLWARTTRGAIEQPR